MKIARIYTIKCPVCGTLFKSSNPVKTYCTEKCSAVFRKRTQRKNQSQKAQ